MNKLDKLLSGIAIVACLSAVAITASAQEDLFSDLDSDADGMISIGEAEEHDALYENFGTIDTNSDGYVSKEELSASGLN